MIRQCPACGRFIRRAESKGSVVEVELRADDAGDVQLVAGVARVLRGPELRAARESGETLYPRHRCRRKA